MSEKEGIAVKRHTKAALFSSMSFIFENLLILISELGYCPPTMIWSLSPSLSPARYQLLEAGHHGLDTVATPPEPDTPSARQETLQARRSHPRDRPLHSLSRDLTPAGVPICQDFFVGPLKAHEECSDMTPRLSL